MSVRKVKSSGAKVKFEVEFCTNGRGSKRLRRRFDTKAEALAFFEDFKFRKLEQKKIGRHVPDFEETTFEMEAAYWLKHRSKEFSPGHLKRSVGILEELLPSMGKLSPIRFQPEFLSSFQNRQLELGLKPATVNRKTEVITSVLSFAVKHRRIPYKPCNGFEKLKPQKSGVSFWERHEAERFLVFADRQYPKDSPKRWVYVVYLLALNTGLRAGEIWGLKPQDLVHDGDLLYIQRQYDRVKKDFGPLKWKTPPRYVPCNEDLRLELSSLIKTQKLSSNETFFRDDFRDGIKTPVCHEVFSKRYFQKDCREAGMRRIRFHDLRHTATTLMIAEGTDVNTVREICGHKSLKTTLDYVHLLGGAVKKVAKLFGISPRPNRPIEVAKERPKLVLIR